MIYHSTRDEKLTAAPTRAVLEGIAPDGGLYVCDPGKLDFDWQGTLQKETMSMAADILGALLPDFQDMNELVRASYAGKFASDDLTPLVPVGLFFGRIGNFINGELWGRVTTPDFPFAMIFPESGTMQPRHPSQLYEAGLEGIVLFCVMWLFSRRQKPEGAVTGLFCLGYGIIRFCVEFVREPDSFLGLRALGLSQGQWLSLPLILLGIFLIARAYRVRR